MADNEEFSVPRRGFLKGAALSAAAAVTPLGVDAAQQNPPAPSTRAAVPGQATRNAETEAPAGTNVLTAVRPGADFMVDVVKSLKIPYICANPGSSFRGLQESIVNYGGNSAPEFLTCMHEESAVAMAHGHAKVAGVPLGVLLHSNVGLQHAAMAIYNAYCDRVPVYLIVANSPEATARRPGVEWLHSAQDPVAMVRDFIKWDDAPLSLTHFAESAVRGYKIAMTPPMMPVALTAPLELQEDPVGEGANLQVPRLSPTAPPQGDSGAVREAARMLVSASNPVLVADRAARTPAGLQSLIELAELLQAPVIDRWGRLNFPSLHALNHSDRTPALIAEADVILGLELTDFWGLVNNYRDQLQRTSSSATKADVKLISITAGDLYAKGNMQDLQRYQPVSLAIAADAEATLPSLIAAVQGLLTAERRRSFAARGKRLADTRLQLLSRAREEAAYAWDANPVSTARLSAELWNQIKGDDWSFVTSSLQFAGFWPLRLWDFNRHHQHIGDSGGYGVGYGAPAAVGAALAHREHGRITVNIQGDGDLMYAPGILWTAAHHRIPLLTVMHNNRGYHQETMHLQRMANRHQRGITRAHIGTEISGPNIDYAKIAQGMGVYAEGPVSNPTDLGPALHRALAVVRRGEPALVDVLTQPR